jgi:hypothetical protein
MSDVVERYHKITGVEGTQRFIRELPQEERDELRLYLARKIANRERKDVPGQ